MISPLLANLYLHWFDKVFHGPRGPARWAKAELVRYADDFVVLARYLTPNLRGWIEEKLETWMGLEINREKTRVVNLSEKQAQPGLSGVHVPIRPRPERPWASLSEHVCRRRKRCNGSGIDCGK